MQLGINTIQQIMNRNANEGLEWSKIAQNIKKISRGKEPRWYKVIQNRCRSWLTKVVKSERKQNTAMVYKLENREKNWCLMTDGTIGRVTRAGTKKVSIQHWNYNTNNNRITRCHGRELKNIPNRVNCAFTREINIDLYGLQIDSNK